MNSQSETKTFQSIDVANIHGNKASEAALKSLEAALRQHSPQLRVTCSVDSALGRETFQLHSSGQTVQLAAGDANGLAYGVQELAALATLNPGAQLPSSIERRPYCRRRGMRFFPQNERIEAAYFHDPAFWNHYLSIMAHARLNVFNLVYGHQTAYYSPPFPWLLEVPGYEHVHVQGLSGADRARNLETLRMIGRLAKEWGLEFTVGIWQQGPRDGEASPVVGLDYEGLFGYCSAGLKLLLEECPEITGLQFRMNQEAGIEEEHQARFFSGIIDVIRDCGRPIFVDLRGKGLEEETINLAAERLDRFTVSTKFWSEHLGLPYFQTEIIPRDLVAYRRYGFWDILPKERPYDFLVGLWTLGSQRVLPWGDCEYGARFARATVMNNGPVTGEAERGEKLGFEVMSPLSHFGFGNGPDVPLKTLANQEDAPSPWEIDRYWPFFMAFGLPGYHPEAEQPVYQAELLCRFGGDGPHIGKALEYASKIIPLQTASHQPSSSVFGYWPEFESGGLTDRYARVVPGDGAQFQSISEWAEMVVQGGQSPKTGPGEVADMLEAYADNAIQSLEENFDKKAAGELHLLGRDIQILAALGRYHAHRRRSAMAYELFGRGAEATWISQAVQEFEAALAQWKKLSELAARQYSKGLVFNRPPWHAGHWEDEIPALELDLARLREIESRANDAPPAPVDEWFKWGLEWKVEDSIGRRVLTGCQPAEPLAERVYEMPDRQYVVRTAETVLAQRGGLSAQVAKTSAADKIALDCSAPEWNENGLTFRCRGEALTGLTLLYRPLRQEVAWERLAMTVGANGEFFATVPTAEIGSGWDLTYRFEATAAGGAANWPCWKSDVPYFILARPS